MSRILLIVGPSGGHLMPVIAVAEELKMLQSDIELHVLCSDRTEDHAALRRRNIAFTVLPSLRMSAMLPVHLLKNILIASRVLKSFRPDMIFSKGGALGLPACFLAHRRGIPIVLHESDAVLGRANRFAARFATTLCLGFPRTVKDRGQRTEDRGENENSISLSPKSFVLSPRGVSVVVTGNPIRSEIMNGSHEEGLRITGLSGTRPIFLVLGGSQGAVALNIAVRANIDELLTFCDVIHLTGTGKSGAEARPSYWSRPFVDAELPHLYACADFALCRSGAGTISELAAHSIPAILCPLTGLAQDHQTVNAVVAEQTGGCMIVQQEILEKNLVPFVRQFVDDPGKRERMATAMHSLAHPAAARRIAEIIADTLEQPGGDA